VSLTPARYGELKALFEEADALPVDARDRFVAELSERDPELAKELSTLLSETGDTEAFRAPIRRAVDEATLPEIRGGEAGADGGVAGFEIVGVLGRGGMGSTARGRPASSTARSRSR
jgi:hypothetical protein